MKKGFTLVELLAVIVILSLLATMASLAVMKTTSDSRDNLYNLQIKLIEDAAKAWGIDNADLLPISNECKYITVSNLKHIGLLENNITNPKNNNQISNDTTIKITATNKTINYEVNPSSISGCNYSYACVLNDSNKNSLGDIGEKVTCGTENFYIYNNSGDDYKLLAEYNLNVGPNMITTDPEGLQNENAKGFYDGGESPYPGAIAYSPSSPSYTCYSCTRSKTCYSVNNVTPILNNYKNFLLENGIKVKGVELIKKSEIDKLHMSYSWIYNTSYWTSELYSYQISTGSSTYCTYSSSSRYAVYSNGTINYISPTNVSNFGIRPVIIIPVSEI